MFQYHCLNPIAQKGLDIFDEGYKNSDTIDGCQAVLVRSAKMHDMELPESVAVIARAGAGVNNIPVKEWPRMVLLYLTLLVPMQMELRSWFLPVCCLLPVIL